MDRAHLERERLEREGELRMPISKKTTPQDAAQLACEEGTLPARAYGGPADGRRWMIPATELSQIHRFSSVPSCAYELALNPSTGLAVRDSFGRYVYLVCALVRNQGSRPIRSGTSPAVRWADPEPRSWPAPGRERSSGRYPHIRRESAAT